MKSPVAELRRYAKRNDSTLIFRALNFAEHCHKDDKRDDGTDYINHPVIAALMLIGLGIKDEVILAAEILHDTIEMKRATLRELLNIFGQEVELLVDLVSQERGEPLEHYYRRISGDIRAILVKAPDNLHNMSNMIGVFSADKMEFNMGKSADFVLPMIIKAQIDYPEYREILVIFEDRIRLKLDEAKAHLEPVRTRDRLLNVFSEAGLAEREKALPALDSERRET